MRWPTLVEFFEELAARDEVFLVYDDGFRRHARTYRDVAAAARGFAADLAASGTTPGTRVVFYSENRPEWIVAFWGVILAGAVAVPVDSRATGDFCRRIAGVAGAPLVLVGDSVDWPAPAHVGGRSTGAPPDEARARHGSPPVDSPGPAPPGSASAASVPHDALVVRHLGSIDWCARGPALRLARPSPDDVAEIVFTSGATGDPRGVLISHRNLLATLEPIDAEIRKYRRYGRPFFPLRFLELLPLSHLFGQSMATLVTPLLPGTTVFARRHHPADLIDLVRRERVSVIVSVPRLLDLLRSHLVERAPECAAAGAARVHVIRRWWRFRRVHTLFGPKFWSVIVGAAPLDEDLERFWSGLGLAVIQGYGLTETAPIVTLNHPFAAHRGSVGKPIAGVEVRLSEDGEILVRGPNVTRGYLTAGAGTEAAQVDGWLPTGDIGAFDQDGRLFIRGRRKELIVTSDGLNVFPDDVERVVNAMAGVRESAVVGLTAGGIERVHAVLVLEPGIEAGVVVAEANRRLPDFQRIRGATAWPGAALPRTEGTGKLRRGEIARRVAAWRAGGGDAGAGEAGGGEPGTDDGAAPIPVGPAGTQRLPAGQAPADAVAATVARIAGRSHIDADTRLDELGLGSLDRVDLIASLEQRHGVAIDEAAVLAARTVGDLRNLTAHGPDAAAAPSAPARFPAWGRSWPVRAFRASFQTLVAMPATRRIARIEAGGLEWLDRVRPPVVFAANHQSHLDTAVILAALPPRWRRRLATAMAREFFAPHFHPSGYPRGRRWVNRLLYVLAVAVFHGFPIPQREPGTRETLRQMGALVDGGWSILIYPEGRRHPDGETGPFQAGVGMVATRLRVPVVPIRLDGTGRVLPPGTVQVHRGPVRVRVGAPMTPAAGEDAAAFASRVEREVRRLDAG